MGSRFSKLLIEKNLDLYYGFLIIPSTCNNEGISEILRNQSTVFSIFNNLFPESFRVRVNTKYRCDESNLEHLTSESYSTPEGNID